MRRLKLHGAAFGRRQRSYKDAEQHVQEALEDPKTSLGEDHPVTATTVTTIEVQNPAGINRIMILRYGTQLASRSQL